MNNNNCLLETIKYYSDWTDAPIELFEKKGTYYIPSKKRTIIQTGYSKKIDIYILLRNELNIVSYNSEIGNNVKVLDAFFHSKVLVEELSEKLKNVFDCSLSYTKKFYLSGIHSEIDTSKAVCLRKENYNDFLEFFIKSNPECETDWLEEYYESFVKNGNCWGMYEDKHLVSATDAPEVPYRKNKIVEIGITTLEGYKKRGYAKAVVGAFIEDSIKNNITPIWSCGYDNYASVNLAKSVGFMPFADVITISLVKKDRT